MMTANDKSMHRDKRRIVIQTSRITATLSAKENSRPLCVQHHATLIQALRLLQSLSTENMNECQSEG